MIFEKTPNDFGRSVNDFEEPPSEVRFLDEVVLSHPSISPNRALEL